MPTRIIRYPYVHLGIRERLTVRHWESLLRSESSAGAPSAPATLPESYVVRLRSMSSEGPAVAKLQAPNWLKKMLVEKSSHEQVLDFLRERIEKTPTESRLREAQVLLNELGRLPDGSRHVRARLTQELVTELTKRRA